MTGPAANKPALQVKSLSALSNELCVQISSDYFHYIHKPTQCLFHQPSFEADVKNGVVSRTILLAIIALAARFSDHGFFRGTEPRLRGIPYIREAERSLDLHHISRDTVRAAVLIGAYYGADGDSMHENLYYTIACRIGGLLKLPSLEGETPLARELDKRLWWTLEMVDVWSSNGVNLPQVLPERSDIPYPLAEAMFQALHHPDNPDVALGVTEYPSTSILAEQIKLNSILADVAKLNRASAEGSLFNAQIHASTEALAGRLDNWRLQLPSWLVDNPENVALHVSSGTGSHFVSLYLGYYHFSQLLFYRYLHLPNLTADSMSPNTPQKLSYAQRCRDSATALCEALYKAYATPGAHVYYSMVGHVLVIASTVQLHILLFSDDEADVAAARRRLERNFQILCRLQTLWRALDISFGRFRSFHDACMKSKERGAVGTRGTGDATDEFRLDTWMVGFLMEFARPVEERPVEAPRVVWDPVAAEAEAETEEDGFGRYVVDGDGGGEAVVFDLRRWSIDAIGIDFTSI